MFHLSGFKRDLLYVIGGTTDPSGTDIRDELSEYYEDRITVGRLYPGLEELVEAGYVEKAETDGRANAYSLTPQGKLALEARRAWEDDVAEW